CSPLVCPSFHSSRSPALSPLSLHDALPISWHCKCSFCFWNLVAVTVRAGAATGRAVRLLYRWGWNCCRRCSRCHVVCGNRKRHRSEEHTPELPSLTNPLCPLLPSTQNKPYN